MLISDKLSRLSGASFTVYATDYVVMAKNNTRRRPVRVALGKNKGGVATTAKRLKPQEESKMVLPVFQFKCSSKPWLAMQVLPDGSLGIGGR